MIRTGSYKDFNNGRYVTYSISGDCGKEALYVGKSFKELAPKLSFWKVWHGNIGIIPEEENNRYYVEQYYQQVLSKLDPEQIYRNLDYSILLCYEDSNEFCHRHIVAEWLELLLNVDIPEIKIEDFIIKEVSRPSYIRGYLEDAMRNNRNMRGFQSLRALYLFEKGEILEQKANELEEKTGKCYDHYRQSACYYRCDADEAEFEFVKKKLQRTKK